MPAAATTANVLTPGSSDAFQSPPERSTEDGLQVALTRVVAFGVIVAARHRPVRWRHVGDASTKDKDETHQSDPAIVGARVCDVDQPRVPSGRRLCGGCGAEVWIPDGSLPLADCLGIRCSSCAAPVS